jgi:dTMP kinase
MAGKLLSFEGIDGCGKGTNTRKVKEYLESQGKKVKMYSFPQYDTTVGKIIARYLKGDFGDIKKVPYELICIAYAADRASVAQEVTEFLENDYWVIMDRYTYSNLFTAAKMPQDQWAPFIEWIEEMEFTNLGVIKPNYNFYLYIDPMVSIQRIEQRGKRDYQDGKDDIHENNSELLINTAKCYLKHATGHCNWFVIDQMVNGIQLTPDEVFNKIKEKLDDILGG